MRVSMLRHGFRMACLAGSMCAVSTQPPTIAAAQEAVESEGKQEEARRAELTERRERAERYRAERERQEQDRRERADRPETGDRPAEREGQRPAQRRATAEVSVDRYRMVSQAHEAAKAKVRETQEQLEVLRQEAAEREAMMRQEAEAMRAEAEAMRAKAEEMVRQAQEKSERYAREVQEKAERAVRETQEKAETAVQEAQRQAELVANEAREQAERMEGKFHERVGQLERELEEARGALEGTRRETEELRRLAEELKAQRERQAGEISREYEGLIERVKSEAYQQLEARENDIRALKEKLEHFRVAAEGQKQEAAHHETQAQVGELKRHLHEQMESYRERLEKLERVVAEQSRDRGPGFMGPMGPRGPMGPWRGEMLRAPRPEAPRSEGRELAPAERDGVEGMVAFLDRAADRAAADGNEDLAKRLRQAIDMQREARELAEQGKIDESRELKKKLNEVLQDLRAEMREAGEGR